MRAINKKINLGIVGLGFVSQVAHIPALLNNKEIKLLCIADKNTELLNKVGKKFKISKRYNSYKKMTSQEKLDGVIVCVQRSETYNIVRYFLSKKIPVLSEKPAALNFKDAQTLVKISKKFKCKYLLGYMKTHEEGVKFTKKILKTKKLGNFITLHYENFSGQSFIGKHNYFKQTKNYIKKYSLNKKPDSKKNSYLKFLNSNCHSINLLRFFFDKLKLKKSYLDQNGEGLVLFENNKQIISFNNIYGKFKNNWIENLFFYFDKGILELNLPAPLTKNRHAKVYVTFFKSEKKKKISLIKINSFSNQIKAFLDYIKKRNFSHHCIASNCIDDFKIINRLF